MRNPLVILIILILLFGVGGGPWWGYHAERFPNYGYAPYSGILGFLVLLLVLHLLGLF